MSRYIGPKKKLLDRFGLLPEGVSRRKRKKITRKKSDYGLRLEEKQKLKFIYGLQETQFRRYIREAQRAKEHPQYVLLQKLETRLDNVVYRLGWGRNRFQSRQLVNHGHVRVNGRKLNIPSYQLEVGEAVSINEKIYSSPMIQNNIKEKKEESLPKWLNRKDNQGTILRFPADDELRKDINVGSILELYS